MIKICSKFQTTLASGITSSASSATLSSAVTADNTTPTLPSGDYGFVIDENNSSKEYVIATVSGTSLTFIKRGLALYDGNTEITANKKSHRKGSSIKITDHPVLAQMVGTFNGTIVSDVNIKSSTAPTTDTEYANKAYVDGSVVAGGVDASTANKGISKLSVSPVSATIPIAVGDNDGRVPTQGENDALVGTSGTPSSSNKYVTNDDTASAKTANKIARRDANGDVLVSTTPTSGDAAVSKTYAENLDTGKFGYSGSSILSTSTTGTWTDINLSSIVGTRRAFVIILASCSNTGASVAIRTNGDTNDYNYAVSSAPNFAHSAYINNTNDRLIMMCATDASGIIEYKNAGVSGTMTLTLLTYIK